MSSIEGYRVDEQLGRSGDVVSSLAWDTDAERPVVLKELVPPEGSDEVDPELGETFVALGRQAVGVSNSGLAQVFDAFAEEGRYVVVTERVEGDALSCVLSGGPISPDRAVPMVLQVLAGLGAAHAAEIVHGHINPDTVMISGSGTAKLLDLGVWDVTGTQATSDLAYMSPEQLAGEEIGPASDIFSVGAVLYRILSGLDPFAADDAAAVSEKVRSVEPPSLEASVGAGLWTVLSRALQKDPAARYATADEFATQLMLAPLPESLQTVPAIAGPSKVTIARQRSIAWLKGPGKFVVGGIIVVAVIAGVAIGATNYQRSKDEEHRRKVLTEADTVTAARDDLYAMRKELKANVASVKARALRNKGDVAAWTREWARRRDNHSRRVAEVNAHNTAENNAVAASQITENYWYYDVFWGWRWGTRTRYTYTADLWSMPSYPEEPPAVRTNLNSERAQAQTLAKRLRSYKARLNARVRNLSMFGVAGQDLVVVLDALSREADTNATAVARMLRRAEQGDVIDQSKVAALQADTEASAARKLDEGLAASLRRNQLDPAAYPVLRPADLSSSGATISATSTKKARAGVVPGVKWLVDGRQDTCWVEGAPGAGVGESIRFEFPKPMRVGGLAVFPGIRTWRDPGNKKWASTARPKTLLIGFSNGSTQTVVVKDNPKSQEFEISPLQTTNWVRVTIADVYPAKGLKGGQGNTVVAELHVRGYK